MSDGAENQVTGERSDNAPQSPEEIRAEIERTRELLGDTVEALAEKTDLRAQASDRIATARESLHEAKDDFVAKARQAAPESAAGGAQQLSATVQRRPLPFAAGGAFAAGVLIGRLLGRR